jgi:hypothetical protein
MERLPFVLNGKVHDRGGPAVGGCYGTRLEIVGGRRASERHVEMRMHVDATREYVLSGGIDGAIGRHRERGADDGNRVALDEDVAAILIGGGDDGAAGDEQRHGSCSTMSS